MNDFYVTEELYADKGTRFANFIVDRIIFYGFAIVILGFAIPFILELIGGDVNDYLFQIENISRVADILVSWTLYFMFYTVIEYATNGRTVGKYLTKTVVVDERGNNPGFVAFLTRSACRFIPFEPFSFLGDEPRGWHDTLSKTYVVDVKKLKNRKELSTELDQIGKVEEE